MGVRPLGAVICLLSSPQVWSLNTVEIVNIVAGPDRSRLDKLRYHAVINMLGMCI